MPQSLRQALHGPSPEGFAERLFQDVAASGAGEKGDLDHGGGVAGRRTYGDHRHRHLAGPSGGETLSTWTGDRGVLSVPDGSGLGRNTAARARCTVMASVTRRPSRIGGVGTEWLPDGGSLQSRIQGTHGVGVESQDGAIVDVPKHEIEMGQNLEPDQSTM